MSDKQSNNALVIAVISLGIGIFFSIIEWKYQDLEIGYYFALSVIAFTFIVIVFGIYLLDKIGDIEFNIRSQFKGMSITSTSQKKYILKGFIQDSSKLMTYSDSVSYKSLVKDLSDSNVKKWDRVTISFLYSYSNENTQSIECRIQSSPVMAAIFLFENSDDTPSRVLLFPNHRNIMSVPWLYVTDSSIVLSLFTSYEARFSSTYIDYSNVVDSNWLHEHTTELILEFKKRWDLLRDARVFYSTPLDIYKEQIKLSDGAKYIHAFDMTDINEWFDKGNLGGCLTANIESAKATKTLGSKRVRRIFLAPSRDYLREKNNYRNKLYIVMKEHVDNSIGCGLVFQTEIRNKEYIQDFVVYDKKVVWVETIPTTRVSGAGYFTTRTKDVNKYIAMFDEVWLDKYPNLPNIEAEKFLNEYEKETNEKLNDIVCK